VAALGVGQGAQVAEDTLLRVFPDGAGIHDDHIGAFGFRNDTVAALGKVAPELFGVGFVLLAAVGLYVSSGSDALALPVSGNFITAGELVLQLLLRNDGGFGVHREILQWILSQL